MSHFEKPGLTTFPRLSCILHPNCGVLHGYFFISITNTVFLDNYKYLSWLRCNPYWTHHLDKPILGLVVFFTMNKPGTNPVLKAVFKWQKLARVSFDPGLTRLVCAVQAV